MQSALVFAAILAVAAATCPELRCQKPVGYPCELSWSVDPKTGCEQCPVCVATTKAPTKAPTTTTTTAEPTTSTTTTQYQAPPTKKTTAAPSFADCAGGKKHGSQWSVQTCALKGEGIETVQLQCYNGFVVELSSRAVGCPQPSCSPGTELVVASTPSSVYPDCCPEYRCVASKQETTETTTTTAAETTTTTEAADTTTTTEASEECPELSCRPPAGYPCELSWPKDKDGCYECPVCRGSSKPVTTSTSAFSTSTTTEAPKKPTTKAPATTTTKAAKKNKKDKKSRKNKKATTSKPANSNWPKWNCQYGQAPDGKECECAKNCDVCEYYEWEMQEGCLWCAEDHYFDSNKGKCKAVNKDAKKKSKKDKKKAKKEKETTTTTTTTKKEKKKSKKEKKTTTKASKKVKAKGSVQI